MKLYSYYRSTATYRVRIALNYKAIDYEIIPINLVEDQQSSPDYLKANPQARVPLLCDGQLKLGQSLAILDYLDVKHPEPGLYPKDPADRAWTNYLANIVACDMHPLNNLSVLRFLEDPLGHNKQQRMQWYYHWLQKGFDALETSINNSNQSGKCCLHDCITVADICLIPQIYNAQRFEFAMERYPTLLAIYEHCLSLPYVKQASPEQQPDYVKPS